MAQGKMKKSLQFQTFNVSSLSSRETMSGKDCSCVIPEKTVRGGLFPKHGDQGPGLEFLST